MPGPIIRSGPSTRYQSNWDTAFGDEKAGRKKSTTKTAKKKVKRKKK